MVKMPRLYVNDKFSRIVNAISLQITQNITPLSTASITLPEGEELPARSYVELFTPYGSAGMFRVRSPHNNYGSGYSTAELEHMVAEIGDYVVKAEYDSMVAAKTAVKNVFSHYKGSRWKLGSYTAIGSEKVALEAKYDSVLNALLSILEQKPDFMMTFDFTTTPWKLNIVKKGTSVVAEGRLSRNVETASVIYDDSELVTRVWYQTYTKSADGKVTSKWTSKSANTSKYGIIESTVSTSSDMTADEISSVVDTYLNEHKEPRTSVSINAQELNQITGERMDKFILGDLYRLNLRDYDLTVELHVTSITWGDVINSPGSATVHLGAEEDTVVTFLHNLDATGSGTKGGSGGGGGRKKQDDEFQEFRIIHEEDQYHWTVASEQIDHANNVLRAAGIDIDSRTGALIYAKDNENQIGSRIQAQSDRISLVVEGTGKNAKIKPASIVAAINNGKSSIKISADHIRLDGEAVANSLKTHKLECPHVITSALEIDGSFVFNEHAAKWKSKTVVTGVSRSSTHRFLYSTDGTTSNADWTWGTVVTAVDDATIYYLGR